eukprot:6486285-Amphidinium_carterae.3
MGPEAPLDTHPQHQGYVDAVGVVTEENGLKGILQKFNVPALVGSSKLVAKLLGHCAKALAVETMQVVVGPGCK